MSAFIVDAATIDVMLDCLKAAVSNVPHPTALYWRTADGQPRLFDQNDAGDSQKMSELGRMLLVENSRSVSVRYREGYNPCALLYVYRPTRREIWLRPTNKPMVAITANAALKNIGCYEYQSCESDDWEETEAYRFCQALKERIVYYAIPYQDDDPWGFTDRDLGREEKETVS